MRLSETPVIFVRAELAFEAKIGVLEEDAGVVEAGAADGEFVESDPAAGRGVAGREDVGEEGRDGLMALVLDADVADEGGEFGADAGETSPVAGVVGEPVEDGEEEVVGEGGEGGLGGHGYGEDRYCLNFEETSIYDLISNYLWRERDER